MNNFTIVRPEHLNHHGYLFGGAMLKWVDEYAWLVASRDFHGYTFVTRAMDDIEFTTRAVSGSILRFNIVRESQGSSSVTYLVTVFADEPGATEEKKIFSTRVIFVSLDENGKAKPLPEKEKVLSDDD